MRDYKQFRLTCITSIRNFCCCLIVCMLHIMPVWLSGQSKVDREIEKASISFRIGTELSLNQEKYLELMDIFNQYKGVVDEITFFTSETHPPLPLNVFKDRMEVLAKRMETARLQGYRSGINILSTIGHHEENLENSLKGNYTYITDIEGRVSKGVYCPNDKNYQHYIRNIYKLMAQAKPDYIWIDDDIRLAGHLPVYLTCFCNNCLNIFEKDFGTRYTRESFKRAINEGTDKLSLRNAWLQHNRNTIRRLFALIEGEVHAENPNLPIGFMTGDRFFEGYDFDNWASTLAGKNKVPVLWRPGGGFYQDDTPGLMAGKSHDIGRQVSVLPTSIVSIQSEIENYTYQRLKKSAHITALEAASHIAAGCTGAAFNVLPMSNEPLGQYEPLIAKLHSIRPFYDLMTLHLGRKKIEGVSSFWNKNSFSTVNLLDGNWFSGGVDLAGYEIDEIGLPTSYAADKARVIKLKKRDVAGLSQKEVEGLLSGGVYMDAEALTELNRRGYGELTGFKVLDVISRDRTERLNDHPLNQGYVGTERDNRQAVYKGEAYTLEKTNQKAEVLSGLVDYAKQLVSECTMGIFENKLGGRICVAGYYPWNAVHTQSKSSQMKAVFRWLSKNTLPGYIDSYHKANLWVREPSGGNISLAFTNASFDGARDIKLKLRTDAEMVKVFDMKCEETVLRSSKQDGPYREFIVPFVEPWQMVLVVTQ